MAINSTKTESTMILKLKTGVDSAGKDVIKNQSFSNVKVTSTDEDIYSVATALANLQDHQLIGISRQDQSKIVNS